MHSLFVGLLLSFIHSFFLSFFFLSFFSFFFSLLISLFLYFFPLSLPFSFSLPSASVSFFLLSPFSIYVFSFFSFFLFIDFSFFTFLSITFFLFFHLSFFRYFVVLYLSVFSCCYSLFLYMFFLLSLSLSGTCCWRQAVPTAIWRLLLRSGSAHCDLALAVQETRRRGEERRRRALIKSNNPHLAGGEQNEQNHTPNTPCIYGLFIYIGVVWRVNYRHIWQTWSVSLQNQSMSKEARFGSNLRRRRQVWVSEWVSREEGVRTPFRTRCCETRAVIIWCLIIENGYSGRGILGSR